MVGAIVPGANFRVAEWIDPEDDIVCRLYPAGGSKAVAKALKGVSPVHRTRRAITGRAHVLGIRRTWIKPDDAAPTCNVVPLRGAGRDTYQHGKPKAAIAWRRDRCLMCRNPFESEGAHNRICGDCKKTPVWRDGGEGIGYPLKRASGARRAPAIRARADL
jgi:hypothetical protein